MEKYDSYTLDELNELIAIKDRRLNRLSSLYSYAKAKNYRVKNYDDRFFNTHREINIIESAILYKTLQQGGIEEIIIKCPLS